MFHSHVQKLGDTSKFKSHVFRLSKLEQGNKTLHQISNQLSLEIEEYQKQTRALVEDVETKTREVKIIREHLQRTEQSISVSEIS